MGNQTEVELDWLKNHGYDAAEPEVARKWFRDRGWEITIAQRDRRDEFRREGQLYVPGFAHQYWVDLLRTETPDHVVSNYASGSNPAEALVRARQRFGSEQS